MKKFIIILTLLNISDLLASKLLGSNTSPKSSSEQKKLVDKYHQMREKNDTVLTKVNNSTLTINFQSSSNMLDNLIKMWKAEPIYEKFKAKLESYQPCHANALTQSWTKPSKLNGPLWRNETIKCGTESQLTPDEFRRFVIKQFEKMTTKILINTKMIHPGSSIKPLKWLAIGTFSPDSDIDTVANIFESSQNQFLRKIVAEVRAKSLFDALGIAMYNAPTGHNFDTESYIDVTVDLKKDEYEKRIKDPGYQNLAFTLALTQIARQLHHEIEIKNTKIYSYDDFSGALRDSALIPLLTDAKKVASETAPKVDQKENIKEYLPIINHLAEKIAATSDHAKVSKLKGILGAYFPEAYYTREALAHVCYSDDRYSQVLLQMITDHLKNNNKISPENIDDFKQKTITPNKFIYAVSALENLGYFFHKLDKKETPYEALKNASKYFFRIARALAGYWGVVFHYDTFSQSKETSDKAHKERLYVKNIFEIASKLERLKRGFLPFSSPKEAEQILANVDQAFPSKKQLSAIQTKAKELEKHLLAKQIYGLHIDLIATKAQKIETLKRLAGKYQSAIIWETNSFHIAKSISELQKPAALEFASLLNLIIGANSDNTPEVLEHKKAAEQKLKDNGVLNIWNITQPINSTQPIAMKDVDPVKFKNFLNGLTLFIKHTLEDYQATSNPKFTFGAINLATDAKTEIEAAKASKAATTPTVAVQGVPKTPPTGKK